MPDLILILLRAMLVVATIIVLTRLHGLRSFSKMSSFDFAITVSIGSVLAGAVTTLTTGLWVYLTALAFLAWFVFAPQCMSTIAVARRETNGWKWPIFMLAYLFGMAWVFAGATYWIAVAAGL